MSPFRPNETNLTTEDLRRVLCRKALDTRRYGRGVYLTREVRERTTVQSAKFGPGSLVDAANGIVWTWTGYGQSLQHGGHKYSVKAHWIKGPDECAGRVYGRWNVVPTKSLEELWERLTDR